MNYFTYLLQAKPQAQGPFGSYDHTDLPRRNDPCILVILYPSAG